MFSLASWGGNLMNGRSMRMRHRLGSGGSRRWPAGLAVAACLTAAAVVGLTRPAQTVTQQLGLQRFSAVAGVPLSMQVCGNAAILGGGPSSAPPGAVRVRAGD